jgi:hypothetical protein
VVKSLQGIEELIMANSKAFLSIGLTCLVAYGFALAYDVPNPNLNNDERVNFADYALLADNWLRMGAGLAGDFDDSNTVDINDLMVFGWYWLTEYSEYQRCQDADLDSDGIIAFEDMAKLAQNWLMTGGGLAGDFDTSNSVDYNDLSVITDCWLKGTRPESIWEQFKLALWNDDLDKALTFIADSALEQYTVVLTQLRPQFQSMVDGMGDLVLDSIEGDRAYYEMLHDEGGGVMASFPVYFSRNEQGEWKIYCF